MHLLLNKNEKKTQQRNSKPFHKKKDNFLLFEY